MREYRARKKAETSTSPDGAVVTPRASRAKPNVTQNVTPHVDVESLALLAVALAAEFTGPTAPVRARKE